MIAASRRTLDVLAVCGIVSVIVLLILSLSSRTGPASFRSAALGAALVTLPLLVMALVAARRATEAAELTAKIAAKVDGLDHAVNGHPDAATMQSTVSDLAPGKPGDPDSLMGKVNRILELVDR